MAISGKGILDDKTVNVDMKQSFTDELDGSYNFIMPISPSMVRPYFKNIGNFFKGSLMTNATVYPQKEGQTIALDFGLKDAEISLPIGYTKEFDKKGTLKATLVV